MCMQAHTHIQAHTIHTYARAHTGMQTHAHAHANTRTPHAPMHGCTHTCMHTTYTHRHTHTEPGSLQPGAPSTEVTSLECPHITGSLLCPYIDSEHGSSVVRLDMGSPPFLRKGDTTCARIWLQDPGQRSIGFPDLSGRKLAPQHLRQSAELKIRINLHQGRSLIKAQVCISSSMAC